MDSLNKQGDDNESWWQPGLVLFSRLSGWIVGPVIVAVVVGKWLDRKYHTEPWLFLFLVGIAFLFSMAGIVKEGFRAMKEVEKWGKMKKRKKDGRR